jgi:glutaredoxin
MYGIPKYVMVLSKRGWVLKISHVQYEARQIHRATPHRFNGRRGRGRSRALHVVGLTKTSVPQVFVPNAHVGVDTDIHDIRASNDAVVLCTGATWPRDLKIKGREADGIHFAMEYLQVSYPPLCSYASLASRH